MRKNIIYACACDEMIRYCCEIIKEGQIDRSTPIETLLDECDVIAFSDTDPNSWGRKFHNKEIIPPTELPKYISSNDICIYISSNGFYDTIYHKLTEEIGIPENRVVKSHVDFVRRTRERFVYNMADIADRSGEIYNVAEGGVFEGDFSKVINAAFPRSPLYLFDTFSGFDTRDIYRDEKMAETMLDRPSKYASLYNTSVDLVLSKLPHPENAIVKKGYFPETAQGVDGQFIFVNLDFDLYSPIKAGLEFFYPKMVKGGSILVHDYFNNNFDSRRAVDEFCKENDLCPMPIGDILSVSIIKQ